MVGGHGGHGQPAGGHARGGGRDLHGVDRQGTAAAVEEVEVDVVAAGPRRVDGDVERDAVGGARVLARRPGSAATVVVNGPGAVARAGGWWTSAAVNASTAPATAVSARSDRVSGATVLPARGTRRDRFADPTATRARKPPTLARSSCP
jgi:hypothetical protein